MANTRIDYLYRDRSNYKQHASVVLAGELSAREVDDIGATLRDGELFIPAQVGLPELQDRFPAWTDDDHVWHELIEIRSTDERPTSPLSARATYVAFVAVGRWDVGGALRRHTAS
jgi:hypothetical protein